VRICTNKTCKKQGSQQVHPATPLCRDRDTSVLAVLLLSSMQGWLTYRQRDCQTWVLVSQVWKFAEDLHLEGLTVRSCGCLSGCGLGPNMVVLPLEVTLNHIGTPARFAEAVRPAVLFGPKRRKFLSRLPARRARFLVHTGMRGIVRLSEHESALPRLAVAHGLSVLISPCRAGHMALIPLPHAAASSLWPGRSG
jgi:hypothetical protein